MSQSLGTLIAKLQADVTDLKRGLQTGRQELNEFKSLAQNVGQQVKNALAFAGVTVGIAALGAAVKSFATSVAMTGARTETLEVAMQTVGKSAGLSVQSLKLLTEDLKKAGITTQESMSVITRSLAAGLDLSKLKELATRARDVAVVAGENTSQTMNKLIHGIISGQTEMFRTLGIPIANMEDAWKRYAAAIGKTKEELTQVEKANATLMDVLQATSRFAGTAAAADTTVSKMLASLARFAEEAKNALFPLFGPSMKAAVEFLTKAWQDLEVWARNNKEALAEWGKEIAEWVAWLLKAIRSAVEWAAANRQAISTIVEFYIVVKVTGYVVALTSALAGLAAGLRNVAVFFTTAATAAHVAKVAFAAAIPNILGAAAALGVYGAYKAFSQPGKYGGNWAEAPEGQDPLATSNMPVEKPKEQQPAITPVDVLKAQQEQVAKDREQLNKEMQAAVEKAKKEAPAPVGKAGGGGGKKGGAEKIEDFTRLIEKELKGQLDLEEAKLDRSLKLLQENQEKKRAVLRQEFDAGQMDGAAYYAALEAMEKEHHTASLALIDQKIAAEKKLHPLQVAAIEASPKLSPEAKAHEINAMRLEHETRLVKLQGERQAAGIENEKKLADLLREQTDWRQRIADLMAQTSEENALGPVAEKEAEINRYLRERAKLRAEIPLEIQDEFDQATQSGVWRKTAGQEIESWASTIAGGFRNLFDTIADGTADLKKALNGFFKSLFSESLEKGFKQLTQWITNALSQMFSSIGSGFANAIMGAIGLLGMMLTSGGGQSSWSASAVSTGFQNTNTALRGIIAGDTSIPIAQISESLKEALLTSEGYLRQIARNTGKMADGMSLEVGFDGVSGVIRKALDEYFRQELVLGVR